VFYSNSDIAAIAGVHPQELNLIERYTLETLGYSLLVTGEEYQLYDSALQTHLLQSHHDYILCQQTHTTMQYT
jgi:hypothetical protein